MVIIEELRQFSIADLKRLNLLNGCEISTTLKWENDSNIRLHIDTTEPMTARIILEYTLTDTGERVKIFVHLVESTTNLGGKMWLFQCPHIGCLCRKLYLYRGRFMSRKAIQGAVYWTQARTRIGRIWDKVCKDNDREGELYKECYKPYFKSHYRGQNTATLNRAIKRCEKAKIDNALINVIVKRFKLYDIPSDAENIDWGID